MIHCAKQFQISSDTGQHRMALQILLGMQFVRSVVPTGFRLAFITCLMQKQKGTKIYISPTESRTRDFRITYEQAIQNHETGEV